MNLACSNFKNKNEKTLDAMHKLKEYAMSMKNKETWKFAHKYCGRLWVKIGTIVRIFSICINLFISMLDTQVKSMVGICINILQTIIIVATIYPVERELKRNFDKNGFKIKKDE